MQMKVILRMRMLRNFLIVTCGGDQDHPRRDLCIIKGEMGQWETISHEFVEKTRASEIEDRTWTIKLETGNTLVDAWVMLGGGDSVSEQQITNTNPVTDSLSRMTIRDQPTHSTSCAV